MLHRMLNRLSAVICCWLFLAAQGEAAITLVQKIAASNTGSFTTSVTLAATPTVGNVIILGIVSSGGNCGISTVTDNQAGTGNVYSRVIFQCASQTNEASVWCAPVLFSSGTFTVSAAEAVNNFATLFAVEYSGLSCNGDQVSENITAASPYSCGSFTTNNANDLLVSVLSLNSSSAASATPPSGYTTQLSQTAPSQEIGFYADLIVTSTTAQTPIWTSATPPFGNIPCAAAALKAGGGGGQTGSAIIR